MGTPESSGVFGSDMINLDFDNSFVPRYKYMFGTTSTAKSEISSRTSNTGMSHLSEQTIEICNITILLIFIDLGNNHLELDLRWNQGLLENAIRD